MNRRNFFSALCAAIGLAKAPKLLAAPEPPKVDIWPQNPDNWMAPGIQLFCELPYRAGRITGLHTIDGRLFAFCEYAVFEIMQDGTFYEISYQRSVRIMHPDGTVEVIAINVGLNGQEASFR